GIMAFFLTLLLMGILIQLRKSHRRLAMAFTLTTFALVLSGALWIGLDVVFQRYSELAGAEALAREGRVVVYRDTFRLIIANPLGVGVDKFEDRFRQYQSYRPDLTFDHAHNDYLETAVEWGMPIAFLFWIFIGFSFVRAIRLFVITHAPEEQGVLLACIG